MKIIDVYILEALKKYVSDIGPQKEAAKRMAIAPPTLSKILSGASKRVSEATWHRMYATLQPYISAAKKCPKGYSGCPLDGSQEFKSLVVNLIDLNDPSDYAMLNQLVTKLKAEKQAGKSIESS